MATNQRRSGPDELMRARIEGRTYTAEELADRATQLEAKMIQLKNRYEQYFAGLDRKPPSNERNAMHKELDLLRQMLIKNTALKFKLNSMFSRFLTYERMWIKTETDIEEGRYKRDLNRARRHRGGSGLPTSEDVDMTDFEADEDRSPQPAAKPPPLPGLSEERLKTIYDTYLVAKRECNEPTDGLTFDHVAKRIREQVPEGFLKQANGRKIDFKVAIKDGKAVLRAVAGD